MDSTSLTNRDHRRKAAASRRAAREDTGNDGGSDRTPEKPKYPQQPPQPQRQPLEGNLLSSLSHALTNIDKHNNDYFTRAPGGGDGSNGRGGHDSETVTFASSGVNHDMHDTERKTKYNSAKMPPPPSQFSQYYKFNRTSLNCILIFAVCYLIVVICCFPMISYSTLVEDLPNDDEIGAKHHVKRGASFQHIRGREKFIKASHAVTDKLGTLKERAVKWEEEAKLKAKQVQETEQEIIDSIAGGTIGRMGGEDAKRAGMLLEQAITEYDTKREQSEKEDFKKKQFANAGGHDHWADAVEAWDEEFKQNSLGDNAAEVLQEKNKGRLPGFMVLGMHRSGTSMLSGLMVKGFGYETGGPLIGASFDNEKGFYERIDVVLQNDEFLGAQNAGWSSNVLAYDSEKALHHKDQGKVTFKEGTKALKFLNNHLKTLPYLQKDPRMCIVLPTWLSLLDDKPAVVFTYRHPLEVAMSLKHREQGFTIEHGLRLWIVYNMKALQNSAELCRVFSTNEAVFSDPRREVQRIKNELTEKCRVLPPPEPEISEEVVDEFVDPKLQHNSKERKAEEEKRGILKDFGKRRGEFEEEHCVARDFESDFEEGSANRKAEVEMYLMAMLVYCDLEDGKAYRKDYEWPDLVHWQRPANIH